MKHLLLNENEKLGNKITEKAKDILLLGDGSNTSDDLKMIENLCGIDSPLVVAQRELSKKLDLEKHNENYNGDVIDIKAIEKLVLKLTINL